MAKCKKNVCECAETKVAKAAKSAAPKKHGVTFSLQDVPGLTVMVAGTFNEWKLDKVMKDKDNNGLYTARVMLAPGEYQYKFYVNGEWRSDAANPAFVPNEFGSINSLLTVADK